MYKNGERTYDAFSFGHFWTRVLLVYVFCSRTNTISFRKPQHIDRSNSFDLHDFIRSWTTNPNEQKYMIIKENRIKSSRYPNNIVDIEGFYLQGSQHQHL